MSHRCFSVLSLVIISCFYAVVTPEQKVSGWTGWSGWTSCSVTCGYGLMYREAYWVDKNGQRTNRTTHDNMGCYIPKSCPVDGNWTTWSGWYWCSSICGPGRQERYRYCVNPKPANGGMPCSGLANESRACEVIPCPTIPPSFSLSECKKEDFMCNSRQQCVPAAQKCDKTLQCHDGSDELKCRYVNNHGTMNGISKTIYHIFFVLFLLHAT
ncbi:semaphorin-5A-like [Saccostrea echinata]|uniref:semaphorin-5A-like n=1 Tax=Saccostrea echinata TaxID=191078 RepID=UPI002A831000|nr:semaphorin-5A-like [Saccostrea echinata]